MPPHVSVSVRACWSHTSHDAADADVVDVLTGIERETQAWRNMLEEIIGFGLMSERRHIFSDMSSGDI